MKCLNLGCGNRFHPDWVNIDSKSHGKDIIKHDLSKGIPFEDNSFDVVYHSHVLEHFSQESGYKFMQECYRVLRPMGILRVAVPDLEQIARTYLLALEKVENGEESWQPNYDWILLELFDQMARNYSGGAMKEYFQNGSIPNLDFVINRIGTEANSIIENLKSEPEVSISKAMIDKIRRPLRVIYKLFRYSQHRQDLILKLFLGQEYTALKIGRFRQSGEVHYWMYDRYSLSRLLLQCGFVDIIQREATESYVQNWSTFNLDAESNERIYKPDSIFMEGIRPSA